MVLAKAGCRPTAVRMPAVMRAGGTPKDFNREHRLRKPLPVFDRAAAEKALLVGQHFSPFPSLGTVIRKVASWQWQSIELASANQP
jgi:hypothetical protein